MFRYGNQGLIIPDYFDNPEEKALVDAIFVFFKKYHRLPDEDELLSLTETEEEEDLVRRVFYNAEHLDLEFVEENVVQFAKQQAMKIAILDSVNDITSGNLSKPIERVRQALRVGVNLSDLGIWVKQQPERWVFQEIFEEKIPTGIHHLDIMLDGGLARKELGVILASPNAGKTMGLVQFGMGASGILAQKNVLHVTLELSDTKTAKRYGARTTFRWLKRSDDPETYIKDFRKAANLLIQGNILVKEFPPGKVGPDEIYTFIETLEFMDYKVDELIVDYPDEMKTRGKERHNLELGDIYTGLRGIAVEKNLACWGASQSSRGAFNKEIVDLDDFAEAYMKAAKADVVLAHCQTKEEEEQEILRYYAAKIRDGDSKGWMVYCKIHRQSHAVISTGIKTASELLLDRNERAAAVVSARNGKSPSADS